MSLQEAQEAPACGEHDSSRGTTPAPELLDVPAGGTCRAVTCACGHLAEHLTSSPKISVISALRYMGLFYINSLMTNYSSFNYSDPTYSVYKLKLDVLLSGTSLFKLFASCANFTTSHSHKKLIVHLAITV